MTESAALTVIAVSAALTALVVAVAAAAGLLFLRRLLRLLARLEGVTASLERDLLPGVAEAARAAAGLGHTVGRVGEQAFLAWLLRRPGAPASSDQAAAALEAGLRAGLAAWRLWSARRGDRKDRPTR
ncbi:MAG: hypothetical protein IRY95_04225 [Clostridia bacterium]|nr:hypothetical protein [Clostridia bacterium]